MLLICTTYSNFSLEEHLESIFCVFVCVCVRERERDVKNPNPNLPTKPHLSVNTAKTEPEPFDVNMVSSF
jgi:hypothetical protein